MWYRRKLVLRLLASVGKPLSLVQIHKLMFLITRRIVSPSYDFIPNCYGCYSMMLHADIHAMAKEGLLVYEKGSDPFQTRVFLGVGVVDQGKLKLKREDEKGMAAVLVSASVHDVDALILQTYRMRPFYAVHSVILDRFSEERELMEQIEAIRNRIGAHQRGLYTIGYEGYSLDGFFRDLMVRNIHTLIDVRKNAFSMRREFCGVALAKAAKEAGICYIAMPGVGIPSASRKELLPKGMTKELFSWYKQEVLPACGSYAERVATFVEQSNTALMCYEASPDDCHRKLFAEFCLDRYPRIGGIFHIRRKENLANARKSFGDSINVSLPFPQVRGDSLHGRGDRRGELGTDLSVATSHGRP